MVTFGPDGLGDSMNDVAIVSCAVDAIVPVTLNSQLFNHRSSEAVVDNNIFFNTLLSTRVTSVVHTIHNYGQGHALQSHRRVHGDTQQQDLPTVLHLIHRKRPRTTVSPPILQNYPGASCRSGHRRVKNHHPSSLSIQLQYFYEPTHVSGL
jgi:hypothetical protein